VSTASDLAYLARLIERALSVRPKRGRAATPDEIRPTLEAVRTGGFDKAPPGWPAAERPAPEAPLADLRKRFALHRREAELLLIALGPELDPRLRRVYGFLQDNLALERPSVPLALELTCATHAERIKTRGLLAAESPLRHHRLIVLGGAGESFAGRDLSVPERVVRAAAGEEGLDDLLSGIARFAPPGLPLAQLQLPEALKTRALALLESGGARERAAIGGAPRPMVAFKGPPQSGRKHMARALCTALGRKLLVVDVARLPKERPDQERLMRVAVRDALLAGAVLYLEHADVHSDPEGPALVPPGIVEPLTRFPDLVFLAGEKRPDGLNRPARDILRIHLDLPSPKERAALWRSALPPDVQLEPDADIDELARKYSIGAGAVTCGAREAANAARLRGEPAMVRYNDLLEGARHQLQHRLGSLADRITKTYRWEDLILPEDVIEVLKEMVTFAKFRPVVYEDWGFGNKHSYGRGLSALFSGPPGTGKTMVAGIMARELDMELFRIDLSRVVSKWIGETEKNLGKVFDEAALSHAIILFDEADSLFAKRTEVKSSVDRYANLEVNYLLQRMEAYEGVSILTTNYDENLDEAFKRRLNFRVEFPFPDIEAREKLWAIMLPNGIRKADEIDWKHLAKRFELSGGNIRNAVLRAAFYAAEGDLPIDLALLEKAATREADEMGKLVHHSPSPSRRR
jgi:ATP-dependent 26S proteasome regulatory subunit